jgi:hypothetical protein
VNVVIDRRFFAAARELGSHADRAFAFLERLVADPVREGTNLERIERAADVKLVSLRVSDDLRAIGLENGPDLVLLHVGHHDDAYRWARTHRTVRDAGGLKVVEIPEGEVEGAVVPPADEPECDPARTCALDG